jgi:nucleoside-diphosphate-sugar epimerase
MAKFLVTGGAGFIGSSLAHRLVKQGEQVRVVDNFSTGFRHNLDGIWDRIEFLEGDLAEMPVAEAAVRDVEFVLHQAAIPSVQRSVENPIASNRANVTATLNVLEAARQAKVERLVYASSSSAYGDTEVLPKVETMPENPISPYALTKLTGEKYCVIFHRIYGLPTVCLRYFNVFGPRQNPHSPYSAVISRFIDTALAGGRPTVYGDGEQSRDFTYIDNVVDANLLSCKADAANGMFFNIGTGERHTLNELLGSLSVIIGNKLEAVHMDPRRGDVKHSQADIGKARRFLGYEPKVSFEEGLRRTVDWFRGNPLPSGRDRKDGGA